MGYRTDPQTEVEASDRPLPDELLIAILVAASELSLSNAPVLVGGQALGAWLDYWSQHEDVAPELLPYLNVTSKDVDFLGSFDDARRLTELLQQKADAGGFVKFIGEKAGGEVPSPVAVTVAKPGSDNFATPNSAVISLKIYDAEYLIDFLYVCSGISKTNDIFEEAITVQISDDEASVALPLMHPLHVFIARVASITTLKNHGPMKLRQLEMSAVLLRLWIRSLLQEANARTGGESKAFRREAGRVAGEFIGTAGDQHSDVLLTEHGLDLLDEAEKVLLFDGWEARFRQHNLVDRVQHLREKREARIREASRRAAGLSQ